MSGRTSKKFGKMMKIIFFSKSCDTKSTITENVIA